MTAKSETAYTTTFILDLRKTEDDAAKALDDIAEVLTQLGATVTDKTELGQRDFARITDRKLPAAPYVQITFTSSDSTINQNLREKLRLDRRIKRIFTARA